MGTAQDCREEQALNRLTVMAGNTRVVGRDLNIMSTNVWPFWLKISTEPRLVVPTHPVPWFLQLNRMMIVHEGCGAAQKPVSRSIGLLRQSAE